MKLVVKRIMKAAPKEDTAGKKGLEKENARLFPEGNNRA